MNVKMGYPAKWKSYHDLTIKNKEQGGSYLGNYMAVSDWNFKGKIKKIGKAVDREEWHIAPQTVNAYYSPVLNEIVFTAAMLQLPFYDYKADAAVNYGSIGAVIGHEISHAFDDIGSRFDAEGNMKDWWAAEDKKAFEEKKQQLVEQFNAYEPLPGQRVNGALTLGENIGDLAGVSVSFDALMKQLEKQGTAARIGGFGPEQRFFIAYTTIWRTKYRDENLKTMLNTDPHSPGMYRALGPLVNMNAFHKAFDIREGDAMYKAEEERIRIW